MYRADPDSPRVSPIAQPRATKIDDCGQSGTRNFRGIPAARIFLHADTSVRCTLEYASEGVG
jgi:hypothetical protein